MVEVLFDSGFEFGNAFEDTAPDAFVSNAPEEAFDLVEPRRRCWGEVHMKTRMALKPRLDFGVLVCGVVVGNQVHIKPLGRGTIDCTQKFKPFLVAMSLHALADDAAGGDIEGGKQCRCSVAFIVVGHGPGSAFLHWQAGLGAIERLDLALLVDREHHGLVRRVEIKPDDVLNLLDETFVVRQLERSSPNAASSRARAKSAARSCD